MCVSRGVPAPQATATSRLLAQEQRLFPKEELSMWNSPFVRRSVVLGFALGGFFDGILLHQILQWHHLLSLVPGAGDLRWQVLWDGYFHALMYLIGAVGLWGLWRASSQAEDGSERRILGPLLIGFGAWHVVDGVLSHWLLGIHRIKLDSPTPLMWDVVWLLGFGIVPLIAGCLSARRGGPSGPRHRPAALMALTIFTFAAAGWAAWPPSDQGFTAVVFRAGVGPQEVFAAIAAADARLVWSDTAMGVVLVEAAPDQSMGFYTRGALLVSGSGLPAGCFNWSRA